MFLVRNTTVGNPVVIHVDISVVPFGDFLLAKANQCHVYPLVHTNMIYFKTIFLVRGLLLSKFVYNSFGT